MQRRKFIVRLGSAAAWPVVTRAQQAAVPMIGLLGTSTLDAHDPFLEAFHSGIGEDGEGTRPDVSASTTRPCRRGGRIGGEGSFRPITGKAKIERLFSGLFHDGVHSRAN